MDRPDPLDPKYVLLPADKFNWALWYANTEAYMDQQDQKLQASNERVKEVCDLRKQLKGSHVHDKWFPKMAAALDRLAGDT